MELDRIAVTVRPRTPWEAIDLGFAMARQWFLPLWLLWLSLALPVYLLAALFLPQEPFWVILIVWWCKPMYEPLLLFWLSRALFGDRIGLRPTLRRTLSIVWPQLLNNLTWRRLSPTRSFVMPVAVLERLSGRDRRERLRVLGRGQQAGTWLTLVGVHFELALEISILLLVVLLLPEELRWLDLENLLFDPGRLEQWLQHIGNILAMSLIAPFYVAAGFALYLARRTELEAWDIELAFRRMVTRRRVAKAGVNSLLPLLLSVMLLALPGTGPEAATVDREQARTAIEAVLEDDLFGEKRQVTYWHYVGKQDQEETDLSGLEWLAEWIGQVLEGFTQGFAAFGKALLLVLAGVALAWLLYKALLNRQQLMGGMAVRHRRRSTPSVALFGLDLEEASLPPDIPAACRALCRQGALREALSLLYRGTLLQLLQQGVLEVSGSATEGECLEQVRSHCLPPLADYFTRLTRLWIGLAYGHRTADGEQVLALCAEWQALLGEEGGDAE